VLTAETLARTLGGCRAGSHWLAPCPAHENTDPSLSVRDADDGRVLVHCYARCDPAVVIGELRSRRLWNRAGDLLEPSSPRRPNKIEAYLKANPPLAQPLPKLPRPARIASAAVTVAVTTPRIPTSSRQNPNYQKLSRKR